ncbi:phosphoribosylformylglycinamidine synthase [Lawsonia intracellularis]|uniref:phosphoribosylformylglycinamidine synthase subunit PurQ n=1 Tax=Lawsonia intracellularis TaxID=29546 RepID=UPI00097629AF|nr:phosphoribosylformylglycinamidine synthase subunit PurQ [Lawsonia intracellularis]OMQ04628.1 phosphoribosylformylglycinamidine synthase [Lawsonia intracellularis]
MAQVNALVITGYGTNSHNETAHAIRLAGADYVDIKHFSEVVAAEVFLDSYQLLVFPGGFLDGDDLGAAQAAAQRWRYLSDKNGVSLLTSLKNFIAKGGLVLGICNGFQLLVKLGMLPALDGKLFDRQVSLSHNDSARFEDRWVSLRVNQDSPCVFTRGLSEKNLLSMPVRHGEGKCIVREPSILQQLIDGQHIVLQYADPTTGEATQEYPYNPNGSPFAIAGLTDTSGRIFGLMPHPEAFHHRTNHPGWPRGEQTILGTIIFQNAVDFCRTIDK